MQKYKIELTGWKAIVGAVSILTVTGTGLLQITERALLPGLYGTMHYGVYYWPF